MAKKHDRTLSLSRRSLLGGATALGAASVLNSARASEVNPDNLPPNKDQLIKIIKKIVKNNEKK